MKELIRKIIDRLKGDRSSGRIDIEYIYDDESDPLASIFHQRIRKENPPIVVTWVHILLFGLTILTTLFAGAQIEGFDVIGSFRSGLYSGIMALWQGFPFSLSLMVILGIHEMGHYLFSRRNGVEATLPYFLPAPTFIGTFGAFIKIKSPIYSKRALLEIGSAGPIAGFIAAVIALLIGLASSEVVPGTGTGIILGDSLLMKFLSYLVFGNLPDGYDIMLNSIAFAGWIGLLVTMLNLFPVGQLDGGHILYAIAPRHHHLVSQITVGLLILLSIYSINWILWTILVIFLLQAKHPPVIDALRPLSRRDKLIALSCLIIFLLTFMPAPIQIRL